MTAQGKSGSLANRIESERKKIEAAEKRIAKLQEQEINRIGRIAEAAGCLELSITDAEYKSAFVALVKAKKSVKTKISNESVQIHSDSHSESTEHEQHNTEMHEHAEPSFA